MTTEFLTKHAEIVQKLKAEYSDFNVYGSEIGVNNGDFPAIGFFLGLSIRQENILTYSPLFYTYVLGVFDQIEIDDSSLFELKQQETFEKLEEIISEQGFEVFTAIEPLVSIGSGAGSFITGWTTTIKIKAT